MVAVVIEISDEHFNRLRILAEDAGVTSEEFVRRLVEQVVADSAKQLCRTMAWVLDKNAELYRRLS